MAVKKKLPFGGKKAPPFGKGGKKGGKTASTKAGGVTTSAPFKARDNARKRRGKK
jgi:hypothetical protein